MLVVDAFVTVGVLVNRKDFDNFIL